MPRDRRAVIGTGLWFEDTIRNLTRRQQQAYLLAYTQPDLNRCGVLAYRIRAWAKLSADATEDDLRSDFADLHASRHVVVDVVDEQMLIRTYVKHDGLLTQPLVVAAMVRDYFTITSPAIRLAFLAEIRRLHNVPLEPKERCGLALAIGADPAKHDVKNATAVAKAIGTGLAAPLVDAVAGGHIEPYPEKGLPEGLPEGYREGLTKGPAGGPPEGLGNPPENPQGQSRSPVSVPVTVSTPVPVPAPTSDEPPPHDDPTDALIRNHVAAYEIPPPPSAIVPVKREVMRLVAEGTAPERIEAGLERMRDRKLGAGLLAQCVAEATPTRTSRASTTDQRVQGAYDLAAELRAEGM